jgi:hypothetical protein
VRCARFLAALAVVGAGCGSSLDGPDATGSAGTSGILGIAGTSGTGSIGGGGGIGGGPEDIDWGAVKVHIAPTGSTASGLTLEVSDQAGALNATLQFPPAIHFDPTDGAGVTALTICGLEEVRIFSCAGQYREDATAAAPGCLAAVFDPGGATGEFIHPSGVRCSVAAASGIINLPPLFRDTPAGQTATGSLVLECAGSDGTTLKLQGTFALPTFSWWRSLC